MEDAKHDDPVMKFAGYKAVGAQYYDVTNPDDIARAVSDGFISQEILDELEEEQGDGCIHDNMTNKPSKET
jgi:ribosomal protein S5